MPRHKKVTRQRRRQKSASAVKRPSGQAKELPTVRNAEPWQPARLKRRDWLIAGVVALVSLALYVATACPTIYVGDSAELAAAAAVFGVAHPPGYPLYTMVTGLLVKLLPGDPAAMANVASGLYGALAIGGVFLFVRRLGARRTVAGFGAAVLALGSSYWRQCTAAEVYSFDIFLLLVVWHCSVSLARSRASKSPTLVLALGLVVGLWLGHRPVNLLYLPSVGLLCWAMGSFALLRRRLRWFVAGLAVAALPYLYLPLASAADPLIDVGDPASWERFWVVITGAPYGRHLFGGTLGLAWHRLGQYFVALPGQLSVGLLAAVVGSVWWVRRTGRPRTVAFALLLLVACNLGLVAAYDVLDIDAFFLPSLAALAVLSSLGAQFVFDRWANGWSQRRLKLTGAAIVLAGLIGLPVNYRSNDLSDHRFAQYFAEDLLASVSPNALLVVNGDTTIHGLWYLQAVGHHSPNVIVLSLGHVHSWYFEQLRTRHPDAAWPTGADSVDPRKVVTKFIGARAIYLDLSVRAEQLFSARGSVAHALFNNGIAQQVFYTGQSLNLRKRGKSNLRFLETAMGRLEPLPREIDMDTKSIFLQYAIAFYRTAQMLQQVREFDLALRAYRGVLKFDPDRHEQDIREEVRRGLGQELPVYQWGQKARQAIATIMADRRRAGLGRWDTPRSFDEPWLAYVAKVP